MAEVADALQKSLTTRVGVHHLAHDPKGAACYSAYHGDSQLADRRQLVGVGDQTREYG